MTTPLAEALDSLERYGRDLEALLAVLGESEASPDALEAAVKRSMRSTAQLTAMENGLPPRCAPGDPLHARFTAAERKIRELRAHVEELLLRRGREVGEALDRSASDRKRRGSYRSGAASAGGSCDLSA